MSLLQSDQRADSGQEGQQGGELGGAGWVVGSCRMQCALGLRLKHGRGTLIIRQDVHCSALRYVERAERGGVGQHGAEPTRPCIKGNSEDLCNH